MFVVVCKIINTYDTFFFDCNNYKIYNTVNFEF